MSQCYGEETTDLEYASGVICIWEHMTKQWKVFFDEEFTEEFVLLAPEVQEELAAQARWLQQFGPQAARPRVDTLKGSEYANMKELRFQADNGVWRVAFAFDPARNAVLLVAGDKAGVSERIFYKKLIAKADARYARHLAELQDARPKRGKKGGERA